MGATKCNIQSKQTVVLKAEVDVQSTIIIQPEMLSYDSNGIIYFIGRIENLGKLIYMESTYLTKEKFYVKKEVYYLKKLSNPL